MSRELLEELTRQGITVTVKGDKLALSAPKGVITLEVVDKVAEHKVEIVALLQAQANVLLQGYRLKYPDAQATTQELQEIADRVHTEGYVLLWSTVLQDFVAFYQDEETRSKIPPGFVPYSEAELWELFGEGKPQPSQQTLRLIHEAKKQGGRVVDNEAI